MKCGLLNHNTHTIQQRVKKTMIMGFFWMKTICNQFHIKGLLKNTDPWLSFLFPSTSITIISTRKWKFPHLIFCHMWINYIKFMRSDTAFIKSNIQLQSIEEQKGHYLLCVDMFQSSISCGILTNTNTYTNLFTYLHPTTALYTPPQDCSLDWDII